MTDDWKDRYKEYADQQSLISLAIVKAHAFSQEYDPNSGRIKDKLGYHYLKEGYTKGFLDGIAFRLTGGNE